MRRIHLFLIAMIFFVVPLCRAQQAIIADHHCIRIESVPGTWIEQAKQRFRIAYGHTSHGSQIVSGMSVLQARDGQTYAFNRDGSGGALSLHDRVPSGDLGHRGDLAWERATRALLERGDCDRNMIMWSWCGGCSDNTVEGINTYLQAMAQLERDYPDVTFVYMTGHLDGTGVDGNLHRRNEQIRAFCRDNGKVLFDFADIESYDPDGKYVLDRAANDNCDYIDANGQRRNWAQEWCARNPGACANCSCAHSQCLNCQMKGRVFWWMMARLAGWEGVTGVTSGQEVLPAGMQLQANYPNPFSAVTTLSFVLSRKAAATLSVHDMHGREVVRLLDQDVRRSGSHAVRFDAGGYAPGVYMIRLQSADAVHLRPILIMR